MISTRRDVGRHVLDVGRVHGFFGVCRHEDFRRFVVTAVGTGVNDRNLRCPTMETPRSLRSSAVRLGRTATPIVGAVMDIVVWLRSLGLGDIGSIVVNVSRWSAPCSS